jgi:NAD(P)-dependent dehydrogenase (short-subunit alcohol dehydrogenase family)
MVLACANLPVQGSRPVPTVPTGSASKEKSLSSPNTKSGQVRFDGRAIIITGAGRGMGRDQALLLASRGAHVVVADNGTSLDGSASDGGPAHSVTAEIRAAGGTAVACTADVATESGSTAAVQASIDAFGRIDGILHNASTSPNTSSPDAISTQQLDLVMRVNPFAGFWLTREAWPYMKQQGGGRILYVASHSIYGVPASAPYASAKSAYIGMARSFAPEGAPLNIHFNIMLPTARTRMTDRMPPSDYRDWLLATMDPAYVAYGASYLMSEECTFNGEIFSVGGGRIARVRLAETEGVTDVGSVEEAREAFQLVMTQKDHVFPKDQQERHSFAHGMLGFQGRVKNDSFNFKDV